MVVNSDTGGSTFRFWHLIPLPMAFSDWVDSGKDNKSIRRPEGTVR